jgi:hypothetical protein
LSRLVAGAVNDKGITLNSLGHPREAVAVLDFLLARFDDTNDPSLLEEVDSAKRYRDCLQNS